MGFSIEYGGGGVKTIFIIVIIVVKNVLQRKRVRNYVLIVGLN